MNSTIRVIGTEQLAFGINLVKVRASKDFECIVIKDRKEGYKFYYLNASAPRDRKLFEHYYIESIR